MSDLQNVETSGVIQAVEISESELNRMKEMFELFDRVRDFRDVVWVTEPFAIEGVPL